MKIFMRLEINKMSKLDWNNIVEARSHLLIKGGFKEGCSIFNNGISLFCFRFFLKNWNIVVNKNLDLRKKLYFLLQNKTDIDVLLKMYFKLNYERCIFGILFGVDEKRLKTIKIGKTALDIVDRIGCKDKIDKRLWVIAALMVLSKKEEFKKEEYVFVDDIDKDTNIPTEILF